MIEYREGKLLGNILSDRQSVQQIIEGEIDPLVAAEVKRRRIEFESNAPNGKTVITQDLAFRINWLAGAVIPDETELIGFVEKHQLKDLTTDISLREFKALTTTFNSIWRSGIQTVGELRQINLAALYSQRRNLQSLFGLNIERMVFAQNVFRKKEPTRPTAPPK